MVGDPVEKPVKKAGDDMTTEMKEVVCTKCGATNIGPQARCLRCQAVLPVEQAPPQGAQPATRGPEAAAAPRATQKRPAKAPQKRATARPAQTGSRFCTQCGAPLKAGARFCSTCGQRV